MKAKRWSIVIAALVAVGGWWFAQKGGGTGEDQNSSAGVRVEATGGEPKAGQTLHPPDQARRFRDFTPEQRVEQARKGHGPGG